ncbi:MAG: hypothetical protein RBS24_07190 [Bacilli bacterium]|nr:hypothetical protein [Bacilli bacterium]
MNLLEKIETYLNEGEYDKFMDELRNTLKKTTGKGIVHAKWEDYKKMFEKLSKKEANALFKKAKKFEEFEPDQEDEIKDMIDKK